MANYNLTNQTISSSFQQLLQKDTDTGYLVDGVGENVGDITISGSVSASAFVGDGSGLTNLPTQTLPSGLVSGSSQIDYPLISNIPSGIVSSSEQLPSGLVSGSSQIDYPQISNIPSDIVSGSSQLTASYDDRYQLSGSDTPLPSGVVSGSSQIDYPLISNIPSGIVSSSSQVIDILVPLNSYTESNDTKWNTLGTQTGSYVEESETGSFARTDVDNNFSGNQNFVDISVSGTGSFAHINYVTGSATIIGDAFIVLNADTPALKYAGIKVFDSGSLSTASFEWNGDTDTWTVVEESGLSANLITAPIGTKGSEATLTDNSIPKSGTENTLQNSNITDDGTTITLGSDTNVTGTISATTFSGMISGSSQVSYPDLSNIPSGIISSSEQLPSGLVSGSSQIDVLQTTNIAQIATTGSNTFNGNQIVNGVVTQNFDAPISNNQYNFFNIEDMTFDNGLDYTNSGFNMQNYGSDTSNYKKALVWEFWDSFGYNYGADISANPKRVGLTMVPSGSGYTQQSYVEVIQPSLTSGTSELKMAGPTINIGDNNGFPTTSNIQLVGTQVDVYGNINLVSTEVNKTGAVQFSYNNPSGSSTSFRMGADDLNNAQSKFEAQGDFIQFGTIIGTNINFGNDTETEIIAFSASGSSGALTIEPTEITMGEQLVLSNYASLDFADDAAAATGGVPLGGVYHNNSDLKIRVT